MVPQQALQYLTSGAENNLFMKGIKHELARITNVSVLFFALITRISSVCQAFLAVI